MSGCRVLTALLLILLGAPWPAPSRGWAAESPGRRESTSVAALIDDGRFEEAEAAARTALSEAEAAHGERSAAAAGALVSLVDALVVQGRSGAPATRALAERSVALHEELFPPGDERLATAILGFGRVLAGAAEYGHADSLLTRALAIRESVFGEASLEVADALHERGTERQLAGSLDEAIADHRRALAIREQMLEPDDPRLARSLVALGAVMTTRGEPASAEPLVRGGLAILERIGRTEHPQAAWTHVVLGNVLLAKADLRGALASQTTGLEMRQRVLRPTHPDVALSLNNLAVVERRLNDYEPARDHQERAIAIAEAELGPDHPSVATYLSNLAGIYWDFGSLDQVFPLAERALAIRRKTLPPGHPDLALGTHHLAMVADERGDLVRAVELYREALDSYDLTLGPAHRSRLRTLWRLSAALRKLGDLAAAESLCTLALATSDSAYGADDPESGDLHYVLGTILVRRGRLEQAGHHAEKAMAIASTTYGSHSPEAGDAQSLLALTLAARGETARALNVALDLEARSREDVATVSRALPEREALQYSAIRPNGLDLVISIASNGSTNSASATRRAWDALVRSRAMVFDLMSARQRSLGDDTDPETQEIFGRYEDALRDLANTLVRNVSGEEGAARVDSARAEVDRLERALAARIPPDAPQATRMSPGVDDALRSLPPGAALIAYVLYDRLAIEERRDPTRSVPSYGAFVALAGGAEPVFVPIQRRALVDSLVTRWRLEAGRPVPSRDIAARERSCTGAAAALRAVIWDPIAAQIDDPKDLFIVPDGTLNLINFGALPTDDERYLVESETVIRMIGVERDLVTGERALRVVGNGILALGDPDFDAAPGAPRESNAGEETERVASTDQAPTAGGQVSRCAEVVRGGWRRLPATEGEIGEIASSLHGVVGEARVLTGANATESAFRQGAPGRRFLHVATHGFFLAGDCSGIEADGTRGMGRVIEDAPPENGGTEIAAMRENPLRLAGLVLAGANRRIEPGPGHDDGILTAEEISTLDLRGVSWAVLSACDTGLGDLRAGEGVFGLRRAFRLAGARTVIMSLWSVEDAATRDWMRDLYATQGATRSLGAGEAIASASRARIAARRARGETDHPFYWAGFVSTESSR